MKIGKRSSAIVVLGLLCMLPSNANAQLSKNKDKFLGNITTRGNVNYGDEPFYTLWNQITCENETKWSSVQGNRSNYSWGGADNAYNYAKNNGFPFKFHTLVWGSQFPSWIRDLTAKERYQAIEEWMDEIKRHYPQLDMIDVVNEAVPGHQADTPLMIEALGGEGITGYDWIIKAFEMAYERWPDAILIYNDFNTFRWQKTEFIDLVRKLRDAGAPIDAYGCQSHDLTDMSFSDFKSAMTEIQNALKMPMYSTEYDIGTSNDAQQLQQYKDQIPYMWESDYCAGITLWGYIYGATWTTDGNSGIIREGADRPAMTWLREYMATDAAKNAKSPFPGMKKEASLYIKPQSVRMIKGEVAPITVRASMRTKTIDHIDFYIDNVLYTTLTQAPYVINDFIPTELRTYNLKAVLVTTDGSTYERLSSFTALNPRSPYKTLTIPGTVQAEHFDNGDEGITFHDTDRSNNGGSSFRSNNGGVDIKTITTGNAITNTVADEWLEYTVNIEQDGMYSIDTFVSSDVTTGSFSLSLGPIGEELKSITSEIKVPGTGGSIKSLYGRTKAALKKGKYILRLNIIQGGFNIDKMVFKLIEVDRSFSVRITPDSKQGVVDQPLLINANVTAPDTCVISSVKFFIDNMLIKTVSEKPYQVSYKPDYKGARYITAYATDSYGRQSAVARYKIDVIASRSAYKEVNIPGVFQAEEFDKGGEGLSFHDAEAEDKSGVKFRNDNEGVEIVTGNNGYALGYTTTGEWLEYTVNVKTAGKYSYKATVSSGLSGSGFRLGLMNNGKETSLASISVPQTGDSDWGTYNTVTGNLSADLEAGQQILRITITGSNCNIDNIELICTQPSAVNYILPTDYNTVGTRYNLGGTIVGDDYNGIHIINGKKIIIR